MAQEKASSWLQVSFGLLLIDSIQMFTCQCTLLQLQLRWSGGKYADTTTHVNMRALDAAFRLIGLEQTVESKPLPAYPFPERTVLVLGRESSGIPAHILQAGASGHYTSKPVHMIWKRE